VTEEELHTLVRQGEGQRIEFKAAEADAADIARAIVALANSGGGSLLLGVGDDGEILGLWYAQPPQINRHLRTMPDLASWRQWIVNVSRHNCEPSVPIALEHVSVEGRDILITHVPDGRDKPYRANGRIYVRIDKEVHEATREEISQLLYESGRVQYERLPVSEADLAEFDDELLRHYLVDVRHLPESVEPAERARLLVNLGLATRLPDWIVPTMAGLLLFGARPQDRLPADTLKCAFFYGLHQGSDLLDRADAAVQAKLCRRVDRHLKELFVFVGEPWVPATNNAAERSLRHLVTSRKISGSTQSEAGTTTRTTLASLFGTWRARGLNPLDQCL